MTEPRSDIEPSRTNEPEDGPLVSGKNVSAKTGLADVRLACMTVATFGPWAGWGLVALGLLIAALRLVEGPGDGTAGQSARAGIEAAIVVLVFLVAGWALAVYSRLMAAAVNEQVERAARLSDRLSTQAAQGLALLEQIAAALQGRGTPTASISPIGS